MSTSSAEPQRISTGGGGDAIKFAGWFLNQGFTGTKYTTGENIRVGSDGLNVYAKYLDYTVKYAVTLWGIGQDKDKDGNTLGLTFGPATGGDYRHAFKACPGTTAESPGKCLHWMTWQEIIDQSQTDPHFFDACLENGCTHEVKLNITGKLADGAKDFLGQFDDGDGAGCLYESINNNYRKWNNKGLNAGGWPASRIRAILNGQDSSTDPSVAGNDCLEASECLLAMFPSELKNGIVAKAVKSDTVYNDVSGNNKTTYDKLWLFSMREVYGGSNSYIRENEGELYQRAERLGITMSSNYKNLIAYRKDSGAGYWWLRSPYRDDGSYVYYVNSGGNCSGSNADDDNCLAPGFCLPGPKEEKYTTKYAVCLWGIDQDVDENGNELGLTFGPATGADYRHDSKAHSSGKDCLHNMTWQEIIEQSQTDPHYFDACLKNGCTHEIKLNITGELAEGVTDYSGQFDDGDGAGCLKASINSNYRKWNNKRSNAGGWPASRIRATLNGQDDSTDPSVAGSDCLSSSNCLLAMFPAELRNGIMAKAVKSDTVYYDVSGNNKTTYDKLWLFSMREVYGGSDYDIRPNEGELYQRSEKLGITTPKNYKNLIAYNEDYGADYWWLRSSNRDYGSYVYCVNYDGVWYGDGADNGNFCLGPGFCLE